MSSRKIIGLNLNKLRKNRGLTQNDVSADLNISSSYLSCLERGERNATIDKLDRLTDYYAASSSDLFASALELPENEVPNINLAYSYLIKPEICHSAELGYYLSCSLHARKKQGKGWRTVEIIHDISPDVEFVRHMANLFTHFEANPLHCMDLVEDHLQ